MKGVGVTLSGGGHRASLFGLGVLLYLADAGKLPDITSIASVSGGSLTNGYVAQSIDLRNVADAAAFERAVKPFARQLAQRGTLFATWRTWGYLIALVVSGLAVLVLPWFLGVSPLMRFAVFLIAFLAWNALLTSQRSRIAAEAFRRTLFSPQGSPTRLADIHGGLDHIFCATDLQAAEQVYFAKTFVYGYRFGVGTPADVFLHDVVQASACLPGAFPARWLRAKRFNFRYPDDDVHPYDPCPKREDRVPVERGFLVLTDGGVYDNMGDEWAVGRRGRQPCFPDPAGIHQEPEELIVVNSGSGLRRAPFKRALIPALGELLSLLRVKDVLYDQTTATRRRMLNDRAREAERGEGEMRIALVNIPRSPFDLPRAFAGYNDASGDRARAVLAHLGDTEAVWKEDAVADSSRVGTTLSRMGTEVSARLLHHAYVLAMGNLHVIWGYPLLAVPDRKRFRALVNPDEQARS